MSFSYLHPSEPIDCFIKIDITNIPEPLPETMKISTKSRRFLKYCATINVEQSLVMPTPIPTIIPKKSIIFLKQF